MFWYPSFHVYCDPVIHHHETLHCLLTKTTDSPKLPQETLRPVKCFHYFTRWVSSAWMDLRGGGWGGGGLILRVMAYTRRIHPKGVKDREIWHFGRWYGPKGLTNRCGLWLWKSRVHVLVLWFMYSLMTVSIDRSLQKLEGTLSSKLGIWKE